VQRLLHGLRLPRRMRRGVFNDEGEIMFWIFCIGAVIGFAAAVVLLGLLAAAKNGECGEKIERWLDNKME
jgi:hypothetical protein